MSFDSIPILDLSAARDAAKKPGFLNELRHALLEVGFLYIKNTGIDGKLIEDVIVEGKKFFDLPVEKKLEIEMKNAPSFLGYSRLGGEITRFKTDWREQIDLSTNHPVPGSSDPLYHNLLAPNQWPDESSIPRFRPVYEEYMERMGAISMEFISLVAEAIGLPANAFDRFFDKDQQHKLKIVKYPDLEELGVDGEAQGVGPHKDSMLTSYLLQATKHRGLQVQNHRGEWIDCPPIDGTLVVAMGQGLEAITQGVCQSTTHRVLSPARGAGARFSVPFFQGVSYDATFESMDVPEQVKKLRQEVIERNGIRQDDIEFTFSKGRWGHLGEATLMNRIKSHPDVGERFYPALLQQIRDEQARNNQITEAPQGLKVQV
ncbi:hypothetical protein A7D00_3755 [Trichophyton violaceum]|uniref:Fe2OG dioxygenase domain-containing protein n=1 Tax=Trichophyton violaceum TaxID=34388 RepID=A0A178FII4_TRIVO|nr:hypothetical protein A7D00_3755 [Trichophyton violaceum]